MRAGRILVAAGVLDQDYLDHVAADLHAAIKVRSRLLLNWDRRRGMLHRTIFAPPRQPPPRPADPGDAGRAHRRGAAGGR